MKWQLVSSFDVEKQVPDGTPLTVSIGVAGGESSSNVEKDVDNLIVIADTHLYCAKRTEKNRVVFQVPLEDESSQGCRRYVSLRRMTIGTSFLQVPLQKDTQG